jgi:hypothetical protein
MRSVPNTAIGAACAHDRADARAGDRALCLGASGRDRRRLSRWREGRWFLNRRSSGDQSFLISFSAANGAFASDAKSSGVTTLSTVSPPTRLIRAFRVMAARRTSLSVCEDHGLADELRASLLERAENRRG